MNKKIYALYNNNSDSFDFCKFYYNEETAKQIAYKNNEKYWDSVKDLEFFKSRDWCKNQPWAVEEIKVESALTRSEDGD